MSVVNLNFLFILEKQYNQVFLIQLKAETSLRYRCTQERRNFIQYRDRMPNVND